ncbi:MAG: undecaprenyldiphospho-muramoylpentapeptide beta-N-acetylglucosaminyltransferase [Betaproteobacteria bacterium]|nr:undecaprenyldiphospho-muramoylpentapeptide beta-N-acetylglucosaminyltransferase [Betaproteobacteria bacterium]
MTEHPSGRTLMIMAGGTGGHIFPGLAVAECLRARGWKIVWIGNSDGMESRLVRAQGYELVEARFSALRGKGLMRKLALPFSLFAATLRARREMRRIRPDVVLGMGGYISAPGGLAAALMRIPLVIHEQNSVPGLANKLLARFSRRVLTGFPRSLKKGEWAGNPVRLEIAQLPSPAERFSDRSGPLRLLVLGGSLGAAALNEAVPRGLAQITPEERPEVVHQAGEKHLEELRANYEAKNVAAHCVAFIDDMAGAYAWADLVLCRSGALTVSELAAAGVASVLIPYPHAVDDHQTVNARFLTRCGAAFLLPQQDLEPQRVAQIRNYTREQLLEMAEKARAQARPEAALTVARICEEVAAKQ